MFVGGERGKTKMRVFVCMGRERVENMRGRERNVQLRNTTNPKGEK